MRVGLHIGPMHDFRPIDEILDFVKRSEGLGFDPILFADSVSLSRFHVHDPYTLLALASRITAKATIGKCVTNPLTRHLSVTTNAAGSIDDISGGRMLLGVGTGDTAVHLIGKKAVRLSTMRESLTVLKKLLSGESVDFEGQALASNWRKPDLPVYLAAGGPKTLALGGELADGLITLAGLSPETIEWVRGCVAEGEAAAGKPKGHQAPHHLIREPELPRRLSRGSRVISAGGEGFPRELRRNRPGTRHGERQICNRLHDRSVRDRRHDLRCR